MKGGGEKRGLSGLLQQEDMQRTTGLGGRLRWGVKVAEGGCAHGLEECGGRSLSPG